MARVQPPSDRLLGFVLTNALQPNWDPERTAARIVRVFGDNKHAIEVALARVRRTLATRPSRTGHRAEHTLRLALELVCDGRQPATA